MSYLAPTLTFAGHPGLFSPVNAPMYWSWTASFASSTADINTSKLVINLQLLDQNVYTPTVIETVGRFKVPPKGNLYVYDPSSALKTYVTFPYDSTQAHMYVCEATPLPTRRICPETEGIVRYQFGYGLEYNPNVQFSVIEDTTSFGPTMSVYAFDAGNFFCVAGDTIEIQVDSGLYQYWTGTASVVSTFNLVGFGFFVTTDQAPDMDLLTSSGGAISGSVTKVTHMVGTFSNYYGYNGTRQYFEKDTSMIERYGFHILSLTTQYFMTDWGNDTNHAIPIRPYQGERARCIMDFRGTLTSTSPTGLKSTLTTYDTTGTLVGSTSSNLSVTDPITGTTFSQICYTVAVFDNDNTIPIVDGYKYKYTISYNTGGGDAVYGTLWYVGYNPCGKYQNYRIKFLNKQGTWAYWNFNYDTTHTTNIERTEYKRPLEYDYTLLTDRPNYTTSKLRGQAVLSSKVYETFTMNSDWISEDAYNYLAQLVQSPEVYIYFDGTDATINYSQLGYDGYRMANGGYAADGTNIPIIITDTNYTYKTRNREQLFNLQISFKYAFDTNLQNQ